MFTKDDRLILGNNFVFRYYNPNERRNDDDNDDNKRISWQLAMEEFAEKRGLK
jgi:hypothetical protein